MALDISLLKTTFVLAGADEPVVRLMGRLPLERAARLSFFVIAPLDDGRFLVVDWPALEQAVAPLAVDERARITLSQLAAGGAIPGPVAGAERAALTRQLARERAEEQPGKRLVVLEDGAVCGLVAMRLMGAPAAEDPFDGLMRGRGPGAEPPSEAVLGEEAEPPPAPPSPAPGRSTPAPADDRVFNAWIDGNDGQPLELGTVYELCFNVARPKAGATTAPFDAAKAFRGLPPDVTQIDITVAIDSDDFTIIGDDQQTLIVPRDARPSKNTVRFSIEPKRNGRGVVSAVFIANNRVLQRMTVTLQVGAADGAAPVAVEARGVTLAGPLLPPADNVVNLVIERRDAGYRVRMFNGVAVPPATLAVSEAALAELILRARDTLKELVYLQDAAGNYVYQFANTTIPPDIHRESLKKLARLGYYLYQKLFFAPGNGLEAQNLGRQLRLYSQQKQLRITIVAERFIFPWALLYDRDPLDLEHVDPSGFWGLKHVVEYRPEFASPTPVTFFPEIACSGVLRLGFICNTTIDQQMARAGIGPVVAQQLEFLRKLDGVSVTPIPTRADFLKLLNNPDAAEQVLYFYCHAVSNLPGEPAGVAASKFKLSDADVTLEDMDIEAPAGADRALKSAPLVFINACQSAELSPYLYDGLVPYLVAKGMRGVVGTEADTPVAFAAEFAQEFLRRFTAGGQPLGELLLALRREYAGQKNNLMGLLYALYSDGSVVVRRG